MKKTILKKDGFTLVELLVVIGIIGLLVGVAVANYIQIRKAGRDAQRKSDLAKIASALEQFKNDNFIGYPASDTSTVADYTGCSPKNFNSAACQGKYKDGDIIYLSSPPFDPLGPTYFNGGSYYYTSDQRNYKLVACLENPNDKDASDSCTNFNGGACTTGIACASGKYYILLQPK